MGKYTMFMDWKNQYSENEYTTQTSGRTYTITSLWGAGAGGGVYKISIDTYPSMQGVRVQNATDPTQIGSTIAYNENISISGPAEVSATITNLSASSTVCKINMEYIDSAGATN